MVEAQPAAKRHCNIIQDPDTPALESSFPKNNVLQHHERPTAVGKPASGVGKFSRDGNAVPLGDQQPADAETQAARANAHQSRDSRLINLPGREVNIKRARLWKEHDTDSVLFDVKLVASDRDIHCNRFILAEESSFFEQCFRSPEFAESKGAIDLKYIDGAILLAVVGSLFTADIRLGSHNLNDILHWAHKLKVPSVEAACGKFIEESLCETTVPHVLWLAQRYEMLDLRVAVLQYIKSSFFLMHRTSLEGIDESTLLEILSADDLIVFSEMQIYRAVAAWVENHGASASFENLFKTLRLQHLQPFEARSLLAEAAVKQHPAATAAITESVLNRLEGSRPLSQAPQRDMRRCVWAIDGWADKRQQKTLRSPHFWLAGSERTWLLSYTSDKAGFHLTCVGEEDDDADHIPYSPLSGQEAAEAVQLTMVLYHQSDYNRARRWRLPKCALSPGEYQGFDWFFKDVEGWVRNDRIVVGVQLRLVGAPDAAHDDTAISALPEPVYGPTTAPDEFHAATTQIPAPDAPRPTRSADSGGQGSSCT